MVQKTELGKRIKEERERLGFTQPSFAALAGASKGSQIAWEQDRSRPNADVLVAWAAVGADVLYIIKGVRASSATPTDWVTIAASVVDSMEIEGTAEHRHKVQREVLLALTSGMPTGEEFRLLADWRRCDPQQRSAIRDLVSKLALIRDSSVQAGTQAGGATKRRISKKGAS